jgi:hypothetical protein
MWSKNLVNLEKKEQQFENYSSKEKKYKREIIFAQFKYSSQIRDGKIARKRY